MKKLFFALIAIALIVFVESCSTDDTPQEITYSSHISTIINSQCIACHGTTSPNANLSLTTYSEVKFFAQTDTLVARINDSNNPMPETGLMSQENRNTIQEWIDGGFKE